MRRDIPGQPSNEYIFSAFGQRASVWDASHGWASREQAYWGSTPVELNNGGAAHYQQQDWLGTERMVTGYIGGVEGTYTSLPFGDGFQVTGSDPDQYHFAGLDYEYKVGTNGGALARFRMYYNTAGRWMSPDLYSGSYDFANPQSFDRYSYVTNNPLSLTDQSGLQSQCGIDPQTREYTCTVPGWGASGGNDPLGIITFFVDVGEFFKHLFGFGGPKFLGSLQPRPSAPNNFTQTPPGTPSEYCVPLHQGLNAAKNALQRRSCRTFHGGQGCKLWTLQHTGWISAAATIS